MGSRYRKRIDLPLGFRVNLSKSGVGYSWGTKTYRITKTANGSTRETYTLPGTGLSYVAETKTQNRNTNRAVSTGKMQGDTSMESAMNTSNSPQKQASSRLICPKCGSANINVQAIQRTKLTNKHHSLIWWLIIGWWWMLIKWLFFTLPALIVKIFAPKRQKLEQEIISVCVCQSCGYQWEVEQNDGHLSLFDRLVPVDSFREKALPFAAAILSFAVTMTILIFAFA